MTTTTTIHNEALLHRIISEKKGEKEHQLNEVRYKVLHGRSWQLNVQFDSGN